MAFKPPSIPISQPKFLIAQLEWVVQINNTRVVIRECNPCFALYDVKNIKQNCPCSSCVVCFLVFPLGWVLHCHCTFTRAQFNINHTCAGSVRTPPCRIVRETLLYTVLYKITLTIVSSIFPRTYFQNYPRQKQKKTVSLQYLQFSFIFRLKIDVCFLIATDLIHQFGCFSILFSTSKFISYIVKIIAH